MTRKRYVYRLTVTDNGGTEPRDRVPPAWDMEPDTGARVEVQFWPMPVGSTRCYLTQGAARNRREAWAQNGVTARIDRSLPVEWSQ